MGVSLKMSTICSKKPEEELHALKQFNQFTLIIWSCGLILAIPSLVFFYYPNMFRAKVSYLNIKLSSFMGGSASRARFFTMKIHYKARIETYPRTTDVKRFHVPDEKVPWEISFPGYNPTDYTADTVLAKPVWADPDVRMPNAPHLKWNSIDGKINRTSHHGIYQVVDKVPRNPIGRTGLKGRGLLGRWGPNHAADPIVTRWKRNGTDIIKDHKGLPILQFISVRRRDNNQWALPGGMVDAGEYISVTLKREFGEEALNSMEASSEMKLKIEQSVGKLFHRGVQIYCGYVDDPRNTDNSWMETVAMNFHDENGDSVANFQLNAGDDAVGVKWMDISEKLELYASHVDFIKTVSQIHKASW